MRLCPLLIALMFGGSPALSGEASPEIVGRASVIDGDTIDLHGERVRLNGIDAPESAQLCRNAQRKTYRCGAMAARVLEEFLATSRPTRCKFVERDRYGRFVGDCYRADGASVAELLVLSGWALDWPRYSKGEYADEQAHAQAMRLGLWAGKFAFPWEWRAQRRSGRAAPQPSIAN
jgi:endonuclease YncB( thermonuclease family)